MKTRTTKRLGVAGVAVALALTAGCAVGPNYKRPAPAAPVPGAYREANEWKEAAPSDQAPRCPWWEVLGDAELDRLETQVASGNQSLKQLAASYEQARQIARADRTGYLPTISAAGSYQRSKQPSGTSSGLGSSGAQGTIIQGAGRTSNFYSAELQAAWEPDLWGRIRRTVEEDVALAEAAAADLASARLSAQGLLAQDYVQLRVLDERHRLLGEEVEAYRRTLSISQNKYNVGVAARSDVISAQAQLDGVLAQQIDVGVQRAQLEHAIAVLIGRSPSEFFIPARPTIGLAIPAIPAQLPSALLERRPDIAAAERQVAAANAKIGVQTAAYFPAIGLSAAAGYEGSPLDKLFSAPFRFWSLGAQASEALLDWGQRHDVVLEARAAYEGSVAGYRQTVLNAFAQVEDNLSGLRILGEEAQAQDVTVSDAAEAAKITLNEYKAGTIDFITVAAAQVVEFNSRTSALVILQNRLNSSVGLIEALGGGWSASDIPGSSQVVRSH